MDNLIMDMINKFGFLLIPGFLTFFILMHLYPRPVKLEKTKADRCRFLRE